MIHSLARLEPVDKLLQTEFLNLHSPAVFSQSFPAERQRGLF